MNIYIHIPFCKSKCAYCAFLSFVEKEKCADYFQALKLEIGERSLRVKDKKVETIYFGGGTPSLVGAKFIQETIEAIKNNYNVDENAEVTLEANPEDITEIKLRGWRKAGVNRLSIGVQTLNDSTRAIIGRRLGSTDVLERISLSKPYFEKVGVDLIAGLPGDNAESFIKNLAFIDEIGISHISLYDLELDNNSAMAKNKNDFPLLDEDEREQFLISTWRKLENMGYKQYEISNFCKDNNYSKHNYDFWSGKDYLGFGLGASSKVEKEIIINSNNLEEYLKGRFDGEKRLLKNVELKNLKLMLDLRIGRPVAASSEIVEYLENEGLMDGGVLSQRGKLLYNYVVSKLI